MLMLMIRSAEDIFFASIHDQAQYSTFLLQAISETEGEITKRQVQISSAGKQAEKLSKECSKTQKDLDKASADLQAKQKEQEVKGPSSKL